MAFILSNRDGSLFGIGLQDTGHDGLQVDLSLFDQHAKNQGGRFDLVRGGIGAKQHAQHVQQFAVDFVGRIGVDASLVEVPQIVVALPPASNGALTASEQRRDLGPRFAFVAVLHGASDQSRLTATRNKHGDLVDWFVIVVTRFGGFSQEVPTPHK